MAHGRVETPTLLWPREPYKEKMGPLFFPRGHSPGKETDSSVCNWMKRGWRGNINDLDEWGAKNFPAARPLGDGLPTNVQQPLTSLLQLPQLEKVWQLHERGEPPAVWISLKDLLIPIPVGSRSSVSLKTHCPTVSLGLWDQQQARSEAVWPEGKEKGLWSQTI